MATARETAPAAEPATPPPRLHHEGAVALAAGLLLMLWRTRGVLFGDGSQALARPGPGWDGIGTISWMHAFVEARAAQATSLWSDLFFSDALGAGLHQAPMIAPLWRLVWSLLAPLGAVRMYAAVVVLAGAANLATGFVLARQLGCGRVAAALFGAALLGLENFDARAMEHLGLTLYALPLLSLVGALRLVARPCWPTALWLGGVTGASFVLSEYHAYFGVYFAAPAVAGALWRRRHAGAAYARALALRLGGAALLAGALIALNLPTAVGRVLDPSEAMEPGSPMLQAMERPRSALEFYTLRHSQALFAPHSAALRAWMPAWLLTDGWEPLMRQQETYELTYHLGLLYPLLLTAVAGALAWLRRRPPRQLAPATAALAAARLRAVGFWLLVALPLWAFALPSTHPLSLLPLTATVGPMFRTLLRSLLFLDVAVLLALALGLDVLLVAARARGGAWGARLAPALAVLAVAAAHLDGRPDPGALWRAMPTFQVPWANAQMARLAEAPAGNVLELPVIDPGASALSFDYLYYGDRIAHGKRVLNAVDPVQHLPNAMVLHALMKKPNPHISVLLQHLGVRYIVPNLHRNGQLGPLDAATTPLGEQLFALAPPPAGVVPAADAAGLRARLGGPCAQPAAFLLPVPGPQDALVPSPAREDRLLRVVSARADQTVLVHPMLRLGRADVGFGLRWGGRARGEQAPRVEVQVTEPEGRVLLRRHFAARGAGLTESRWQLTGRGASLVQVRVRALGEAELQFEEMTCRAL